MEQQTRTPVPLTDSERAEIRAAAKRTGLRSIADYMRFVALREARKDGE